MSSEQPSVSEGRSGRLKWVWIAVAAVLISGQGVAIFLQQREIDELKSGASCAGPREAVDKAIAADTTQREGLAFYVVLQNPNCFSAADRATAQSWIDRNKQADADAMRVAACKAAGQPWWKCEGPG